MEDKTPASTGEPAIEDQHSTNTTVEDETILEPKLPKEDLLLKQFVLLANLGLEISITLNVDGFLVSGILVGGKTYFDALIAQIHDAKGTSNEESLKVIEEMLTSFRMLYLPPDQG